MLQRWKVDLSNVQADRGNQGLCRFLLETARRGN